MKVFRGKFLDYLKRAWRRGKIKFFGDASRYNCDLTFLNFFDRFHHVKWVVYCKKPFKSAKAVLNYLGRYRPG
ncbi:MAG: transposase [Clostridia bacterium]|nr:transposase [Clostridia bacterium]